MSMMYSDHILSISSSSTVNHVSTVEVFEFFSSDLKYVVNGRCPAVLFDIRATHPPLGVSILSVSSTVLLSKYYLQCVCSL